MNRPWKGLLILVLLVISLWVGGTRWAEYAFRHFVFEHEARVAALSTQINAARYLADVTGDKKYYREMERLELESAAVYRDSRAFLFLNTLKRLAAIEDPLLKRELQLLCKDYQSGRVNPTLLKKTIALEDKVAREFAVYRPRYGGEKVTYNQLSQILKQSTNDEELRTAWLAAASIAPLVEPRIVQLVHLRNEIARQMGYADYFKMQLALHDQDEERLDSLFAAYDHLTRQEYENQKRRIDERLALRYGLSLGKLMPWHYQQVLLQEAPAASRPHLDAFYRGQDVVALVADYYRGIGLPVDEVIKRSDLYPRMGKYPYAYCLDIDRGGDVRVLANVSDDAGSVETLLHEFAHAAYDLGISPQLPWRLREPPATYITEAVAMMFARLYADPAWIEEMTEGNLSYNIELQEARKATALDSLIFSRFALVVYNFEKALYADPDQDLSRLWWRLVERYELVRCPEEIKEMPLWAAKVHLATAPAYYHNYLLGEFLAYQMEDRLGGISGKKGRYVAEILKKRCFSLGARYSGDETVKMLVDEEIDPHYMVERIRNDLYYGSSNAR